MTSEYGKILEEIRLKNSGKLRPDDVVSAASVDSHPLHKCFNWDDGDAAHQYRLWQARTLIRSVKVTFGTTEVPEFVNVKINKIQYYQRADVLRTNFDEWASALNTAKQRLTSAESDLKYLETLANPTKKREVSRAMIFTGKAQKALQLAM